MRIVLAICFVLGLASGAAAQEDDRGLLQRLIEDNLSDAGRDVRIEGFEGALSSQASLSQLTIADEKGVWLTLKDAQLDWTRSALLSGRLEIEALTAAEIILPRLPESGAASDESDASEFALPELPVSVRIGTLRADKVTLGEPVLGQAATLSLRGTMQLADGAGQTTLHVKRLDRAGAISLDSGFDNDSRELSLDLSVTEAEGGLLASLARLPGRPAVSFTAKGTGSIDDFRAVISLASAGQERLGGMIGTKHLPDSGARQITASLSGDMTPLFAPELQPFFGPDVQLGLLAQRDNDGTVKVEQFVLTAAQMKLAGNLVLASTGLPESFALTGEIDGDGPVVLPLSGPVTTVDQAEIRAAYDQTLGESWTVDAQLHGLKRDGFELAQAKLSGEGNINQAPQSVSAQLKFVAEGVDPGNEAIATALGSQLVGTTDLIWAAEAPLQIRSLDLQSGDTEVQLSGELELGTDPVLRAQADLVALDLSRFSALAGRSLGGGLTARFDRLNWAANGDIQTDMAATGQDLRTGVATLERLLAGESDLAFTGGLRGGRPDIVSLDLKTGLLQFSAQRETAEVLAVVGRLVQVSSLFPEIPGALELFGSVTPRTDGWVLDIDATGPADLTLQGDGWVASDASTANLSLTGSAPLALVNGFIAPRTVQGTARYDLRLDGPLALSGLVGKATTTGARLADPLTYLVLEDLDATMSLSDSSAVVQISAEGQGGGTVVGSGSLSLSLPMMTALEVGLRQLVISNPALFRTEVDGDLTLRGPLLAGAVAAGRLVLNETEVRVPSSQSGLTGPIPVVTHRNEPSAVRATRQKAGLLDQRAAGTGPGLGLDLRIDAPNRIFLRGQGLEAELGGQLRLAGTTDDVIPSGRFDLLRGRLQILGQRLDITEGYATLLGSLDPYVRLVAEARAEDITARVTLEGEASDPTLTFSSTPELPEDEVLARLLFGRSVQTLSPFQAAELAVAVTGLAGGGGSTLLGRLREGFGLDDLDLTSDEAGETSVRVGKYLTDNVYSDITVGSTGESEINLNLDLSPHVTVRGGLDSLGESNLGIFFERDY